MVDENKIKLMTRLAVYEEQEKSRNLVISKYYKNDYVRYNVLKTLVASTVVYWAIVGSYVFMKFDDLLAKINDIDYFAVMYKLLGGYVAYCLIYFLFASILYHYRYAKAKPGLVEYNTNLRDLIELEGGPMHRGKVVANSEVNTVSNGIRTNTDRNSDTAASRRSSTTVNRTELMKKRMEQEEKLKAQQIVENVQQRNARIASQNEAKQRQQRQMEYERRKIQERRKQLEQEQLLKLRNERMQQMARDNYAYHREEDLAEMEGRDK